MKGVTFYTYWQEAQKDKWHVPSHPETVRHSLLFRPQPRFLSLLKVFAISNFLRLVVRSWVMDDICFCIEKEKKSNIQKEHRTINNNREWRFRRPEGIYQFCHQRSCDIRQVIHLLSALTYLGTLKVLAMYVYTFKENSISNKIFPGSS